MKKRLFIACILVVLGTAMVLRADETAGTGRDLLDYIICALRNNPEFQAQRLEREAARISLRSAKAVFLPSLETGINKSSAADSDSVYADISLSQQLPWGGFFSLGYDIYQHSSGKEDAPALRLNVSQPILRDFGLADALYETRAAAIRLQQAETDFIVHRDALIYQVISTYLELFYLQETLAFQEQIAAQAEQEKEYSRQDLEQGLIAPLDHIFYQEQSERNHLQLLQIRNQYKQARRAFERITGVPFSERRALAVTSLLRLLDALPQDIDIEATVQQAPAFRSQELVLKLANLRESSSRTGRLPNLALQAARTFDDDAPSWSVGVSLSLPVFRDSSFYSYLAAKLDTRQARYAFQYAIDGLKQDLRALVDSIGLKKQEYAISKHLTQLSKEKYQGELEKFNSGATTLKVLFDIKSSYESTAIAEKRVLVSYLREALSYYTFTGTLSARVLAGAAEEHRAPGR